MTLLRHSVVTMPHCLRASQKRSYAALVRNTRSRPSALLSSVCGSGITVGHTRPVALTVAWSRQMKKVMAMLKSSGLLMRRRMSEPGSVRRLRAQSTAAYRTVVSYAGEKPFID